MGDENGMPYGEWAQMEACLSEELEEHDRRMQLKIDSAEAMDEALGRQLRAFVVYQKRVAARNRRALRDRVWITAEGKRIPISEMDNLHLRNAYRWLSRQEKKGWRVRYMSILEEELSRRGIDV